MKILVLHGPNLNLLGERRPELYGRTTLAELDARLHARAAELGLELRSFQSNHEGELLDRLHAERRWMDALVINPGAYSHTSYALRDGIEAVAVRAVEVHLTDIHAREPWRAVSVIAEVCERQIVGQGVDSYLSALEHLAGARVPARAQTLLVVPAPKAEPAPRPQPEPTLEPEPVPEPVTKTIGRAPPRAPAPPSDGPTRDAVRERLRERLSGRLSAAALADWAKGALLELDGVRPPDPKEQALLEDVLLRLSFASRGRGVTDEELVELLASLD